MRIFAIFGLMAWASTATAQGDFVTIGTGSITGVYFPMGGAICRLLNKERDTHGYRCVVDPTGGSIDNLNALRDGFVDIGIVQTDVQYDAVNGVNSFDGEAVSELRAMFSGHAEAFTLLVKNGGEIKEFNDLVGKRVNIGHPGSGNRATMELLMDAHDLLRDDFAEASELGGDDMLNAMCDGNLDAAVYTIGHPSALIKELTGYCDVSILPVSGDDIIALMVAHPFYQSVSIPGGMYPGNSVDIETIGVAATVVTMADADDVLIYTVTRAIFENIAEFRGLHPAFANLVAPEMATQGISAPYHPAALRALEELRLFDPVD